MKLVVLEHGDRTGDRSQREHVIRDGICSLAERLEPFRDRITVKQGNLLDLPTRRLLGHDAILSAFGRGCR